MASHTSLCVGTGDQSQVCTNVAGTSPNEESPQPSGLTLSPKAASFHPHPETWEVNLRPKTTTEKESASCDGPLSSSAPAPNQGWTASLRCCTASVPGDRKLTMPTFHPPEESCLLKKCLRHTVNFKDVLPLWGPTCSSLRARDPVSDLVFQAWSEYNHSRSCSGPNVDKRWC